MFLAFELFFPIRLPHQCVREFRELSLPRIDFTLGRVLGEFRKRTQQFAPRLPKPVKHVPDGCVDLVVDQVVTAGGQIDQVPATVLTR